MTTGLDLDKVVDGVCGHAVQVRGDVHDVVTDQVDRLIPLATPDERSAVIARAVARLDGLDALDEHLSDPTVDEVMVNRGHEVWIERHGSLTRVADLPPGAIDVVLERVLAPIGRRLDRSNPIVDARLPDGSRLCAVVAPIAVDGTSVSIRRHRSRRFLLDRFACPAVGELLCSLVRARTNVLITGATSSGKTTLLAALVDVADRSDRLVVIEDTAELGFDSRHVVRLETRVANPDGVRAIDAPELVRAALRLRPDRLVIGEFRGAEVLAVVQALNTGHDGSLATCHANSAVDGLRRVETLVMHAAPTWPLAAIRRHVSRSIDVVVHVERSPQGERRVVEVLEVVESSDEPTGRGLVLGEAVVGELTRGRV
jgi:pilus assembly protein CpaF